MWVLMYVFSYSVNPAATNDKAEWRVDPNVVFQEFTNEERCKTAKATLEGSLKEAGAKLRSAWKISRPSAKVTRRSSSSPTTWNAFRNKACCMRPSGCAQALRWPARSRSGVR